MTAYSNPNGESFDPDGIPQRGSGLLNNYPVRDRAQGT